jgi:hypothetical protein
MRVAPSWRLVALLAGLLFLPLSTAAHSWYEPECCGGSDCHPLTDEQVKEVRTGYLVSVPDHDPIIVPYGTERPSHDRFFHLCWPSWAEKPSCFYAPPKGV